MELAEVVAVADAQAAEPEDALQRFHAVEFPASHGSRAMRLLSSRFGALSALGFAHLKRMKKASGSQSTLVALVAPADGDSGVETIDEEAAEELKQQLDARLTTVEALKRPPRSRELWAEHTKRWPLVFHASVLPEDQGPPPISEREEREMETHVCRAMDLGRAFAGELQCARGCVIIDPEGDSEVATSDVAASHAFLPIWHPVMAAIDVVADRDRQKELGLQQQSPKRARVDGEGADSTALDDLDFDDDDDDRESYLCTGYDVYLDREPCAMCAMGLVHSRARRVIFNERNETDGVLAGPTRLHTMKSLNHHYRVFQLSESASSDR